ncbi:hypothetical protein [Actinoallomurus iriomotensis]|uniref:Uncharacterized protein n=1 Tax=Actinoallomurus iriomotensis TaxID=478107 RepID=A0A9W6W0W0_9ACTN|nr:hypothetical protein [Actinoallomurus iriomotensis]GLY86152.1 hypothetical protein Airi02_040810 [Actinoallomurus iriomotensis]
MNEVNRSADPADETLRPQVRVLAAGAVVGVVLLGAAVVVDLTGANDARTPQLPTPGSTSVPKMPGMPSMPSEFPSGVPTGIPTTLPSFPTDLPTMPSFPGSAP